MEAKLATTTVDGVETLNVTCPHCLGGVYIPVNSVNCAIFRHAVHKSSGESANPHATKAELDKLLAAGDVLGCGGPFRLNNNRPEVCDYI
jgi:hypothetical protein